MYPPRNSYCRLKMRKGFERSEERKNDKQESQGDEKNTKTKKEEEESNDAV